MSVYKVPGKVTASARARCSVTGVSNIVTSAVRLFAKPGQPLNRFDAEELLSAMRAGSGSYWVPVTAASGPEGCWLDVQFGSAKNPDWSDFWESCAEEYDSLWERSSNDGGWPDVIAHSVRAEYFHLRDPRSFRYGFDQVVVVGPRTALPKRPGVADNWSRIGEGTWTSSAEGTYQSLNDRTDMREGPSTWIKESGWEPGRPAAHPSELTTPTTPARYASSAADCEPAWLTPLLTDDGTPPHPDVERVDLFWQGRLVHRAQMYPDWEIDDDAGDGNSYIVGDRASEWQHRSADGWDNCLDADYLNYLSAWSTRWNAARS